jgi:hypothetical protein
LYALLHLIRFRVVPDLKQIGDRHFQNNKAEQVYQGDNPNGNTGYKSRRVYKKSREFSGYPVVIQILDNQTPASPCQNDHEPDNPGLYQKVDDPLGDTGYPRQDAVDDKVLVVPHGPDGTQVHQVYEAKPGDFLGPRKTLAKDVPKHHIHKDKDYHDRQKEGNENFNTPEKGIQKLFQ